MAAPKDLITPGIGFSPGGIAYIITRGLDIGEAQAPTSAKRFINGHRVYGRALPGSRHVTTRRRGKNRRRRERTQIMREAA